MKQISIRQNNDITKQRKGIVEHPFGILKCGMDSGYCLTKQRENVSGEFSLAFLAFNLKRAIKILGTKNLIQAVQA